MTLHRRWRLPAWLGAVVLASLAGCAGTPGKAAIDAGLLDDSLFGTPTDRISTDDVLRLSEPMRRYLAFDIADDLRTKGAQKGLVDALHKRGLLKLDYDSAVTRNAAEAFDARAGNCLSLIVMTAAFARELNLPTRFQSARLEETWSRSGTLLFTSGHVNISLGQRVFDTARGLDASLVTIDFLPSEDIRGLRTREIGEETVLAMYANNRAAEALAQERLADAYGWAVEALRSDPTFVAAYNTLGVVYLRRGALPQAARVFERVLEHDPEHTRALANLAETYSRQGRGELADATRHRLVRLEPHPPFHFFQLGLDAARRHDWAAAREHFAREVQRDDRYHEFQFWLGVADYELGDMSGARRRLRLAMDTSTTRGQQEIYAAKLARLQQQQQQQQPPSGRR